MDAVKHFKAGCRQSRFDVHRKYGGLNGHTAQKKSARWIARWNAIHPNAPNSNKNKKKPTGPLDTSGNNRYNCKSRATLPVKVVMSVPADRSPRVGKKMTHKYETVNDAINATKPIKTECRIFPAWVEDADLANSNNYSDEHVVFAEARTTAETLAMINEEIHSLHAQLNAAASECGEDLAGEAEFVHVFEPEPVPMKDEEGWFAI